MLQKGFFPSSKLDRPARLPFHSEIERKNEQKEWLAEGGWCNQ